MRTNYVANPFLRDGKALMLRGDGEVVAVGALTTAHKLGYFESNTPEGRASLICEGAASLARAGIYHPPSQRVAATVAELLCRSRCIPWVRRLLRDTHNEAAYARLCFGFFLERKQIKESSPSTTPLRYCDVQTDIRLIFYLVKQHSTPTYITVWVLRHALREMNIIPDNKAAKPFSDDVLHILFDGALPRGESGETIRRQMMCACKSYGMVLQMAKQIDLPWVRSRPIQVLLLQRAAMTGDLKQFGRAVGYARSQVPGSGGNPIFVTAQLECLCQARDWEAALSFFKTAFFEAGVCRTVMQGHLLRGIVSLVRLCAKKAGSVGDVWETRAVKLLEYWKRTHDGATTGLVVPMLEVFAATGNAQGARTLVHTSATMGQLCVLDTPIHYFSLATMQDPERSLRELTRAHEMSYFYERFWGIFHPEVDTSGFFY